MTFSEKFNSEALADMYCRGLNDGTKGNRKFGEYIVTEVEG